MDNLRTNSASLVSTHDAPRESTLDSWSPETLSSPTLIESQDLSRQAQVAYWTDVLPELQRLVLYGLIIGWSASLAFFLQWWLQLQHVVTFFGFVVNSLLVLCFFAVPGYFLFFLARMRTVNSELQIPHDWRVAMVTTRAPSEPFALVQRTLLSMLTQETPHDTWLADECPSQEVLQWCEAHGVQVSTRHGVAAYQRTTWPRRAKCKEGNLAYFYDRYGYEEYDFVVQMDADHVPGCGYLEAMLRPFLDEQVGYVSAPSICDSNADASWSARGRLYLESLMHGPLQAGYTDGFAPLCIGSHYAVRTIALREIGGLGPELAEDHSTTLTMNAHGWKGVHALDAEAHGEGPATFADCITQEFQWSRSLAVLLLTELPRQWKSLPVGKRMQFLFCELWYALFSLSMLVGLSLPAIAIIFREPWVDVTYLQFLLHALPLSGVLLGTQYFLKRNGLLRPRNSPLFSWEAALFTLVRWPWTLYGTVMGIKSVFLPQDTVFRVTPKGDARPTSLPWRTLLPYILIVLISFAATFPCSSPGEASGYFFFIILTQIFYTLSAISLVTMHYHETTKQNQ